jgi:hypothetical protein
MVDGKMKHAFSIGMKPKKHVLFEGALSELEELSMVESAVLEVRGATGILRIDLSEDGYGKRSCKIRRRNR